MFKNVGKTLQITAIVLFCLMTIASVILAFVFGFQTRKYSDGYYSYYSYSKTEFQALPFFGFLIGGPIASYIGSLLLYGFGCIVMDYESEKPDENKSKDDSNIQWLKK